MDQSLFTKRDAEVLVFQALQKKIGDSLEGYSSPLTKILASVVEENEPKLRELTQKVLSTVFSDESFEKLVKEEFKRKVAKNLVGKLEGSVEKAVNNLCQDPTLKARMILAIQRIIDEPTPSL